MDSPQISADVSSADGAKPRADDRWRLTIGQLLLWMATTGVVLAFVQACGTRPLRNPSVAVRMDWTVNRLLAPAYGAVLAGIAIVLKRLADGKTLQPGHWFFPILAGWTVCLAVFAAAAEWLLDPRDHRPAAAVFIAAMLVVCGLAAVAAWRQRGEGDELWFSTFLLLAVVAGGLAASDLLALALNNALILWLAVGLFAVSGSMALMSVLAAIAAMLSDQAYDRPRDGLHWIGIFCFLLVGSHPALLLWAWVTSGG